jgi:hypothetical protein
MSSCLTLNLTGLAFWFLHKRCNLQASSLESEALKSVEALVQQWPITAHWKYSSGRLPHHTSHSQHAIRRVLAWSQPTQEQPVAKATVGVYFNYEKVNFKIT